nr:hypothetical protein [Luteibacter rhizovicinus]
MLMFVFVASWVVVTILLGALGVRHFVDSVMLALIPAVLLAAWVKSRRTPARAGPHTAPGEPPLHATYTADNLALDVPGRRLWLRDERGREMILDLSQIAGWEHTWRDSTNGNGRVFRTQNAITFRLRQLDVPSARVHFRRYSDVFGGSKNFLEAEEWQARLTTLING